MMIVKILQPRRHEDSAPDIDKHTMKLKRMITVKMEELNLNFLQFLVACTRLYKPLCRSVGQSVGRSVRRSVGPSVAASSEHATYGDRPFLIFYGVCENIKNAFS